MFSQRRSHYWSQQSRTFFFKGFSAKQQKNPKKAANYSVIEQNALSDKHPKMTGQNDRPDESLTGQAHYRAGHCPLTGRHFEPCLENKTYTIKFMSIRHQSFLLLHLIWCLKNENVIHILLLILRHKSWCHVKFCHPCVYSNVSIAFFSLLLDINECSTNAHNCDANAFCSNFEGSYNCTCSPGYSGNAAFRACNLGCAYTIAHST